MLRFGEDANGEIYVLANKTGVPFEETEMSSNLPPVVWRLPDMMQLSMVRSPVV